MKFSSIMPKKFNMFLAVYKAVKHSFNDSFKFAAKLHHFEMFIVNTKQMNINYTLNNGLYHILKPLKSDFVLAY